MNHRVHRSSKSKTPRATIHKTLFDHPRDRCKKNLSRAGDLFIFDFIKRFRFIKWRFRLTERTLVKLVKSRMFSGLFQKGQHEELHFRRNIYNGLFRLRWMRQSG